MSHALMSDDVFRPPNGLLQSGHRLVSYEVGHFLYVDLVTKNVTKPQINFVCMKIFRGKKTVPRILRDLKYRPFKDIFRKSILVDMQSQTFVDDFLGVHLLVADERYCYHRDVSKNGFFHRLNPALRYKQQHVLMTWKTFLLYL